MARLGRKATLVAVAAVALVVGVSGPASAAPPAIGFMSPSPAAGLTSDSDAFRFTYTKKPKATGTLVCTLEGPTSSTGPCDSPVAFGASGSQSGTSHDGLANGLYTFTVSLTLTDGGTASATRQFGVAVAARHLDWTNLNLRTGSGTIGRANVDGTGATQSFITGATNPAGVAVDPA